MSHAVANTNERSITVRTTPNGGLIFTTICLAPFFVVFFLPDVVAKLLVGSVMVAVVSLVWSLRPKVVLDKELSVVRESGFGRSATTPLDGFEYVAVTKEFVDHKRRMVNYNVSVHAKDRTITVTKRYWLCGGRRRAMEIARRVAMFLNLPLHDSSYGPRRVLPAEDLCLNLQQRLRQLEVPIEIPRAPEQLRTSIEFAPDQILFTINPSARRTTLIFGTILCIAFGAAITWVLSYSDFEPFWANVFGTVAAVSLIVFTVFASTERSQVSVTFHKVELLHAWLLWKNYRRLALDEIQDVFVAPPLILQANSTTLRFGKRLRNDELVFIESLIKSFIQAPSNSKSIAQAVSVSSRSNS